MANTKEFNQMHSTREVCKASKQSFRNLGEGIMHQVWTSLPDGKIAYVNRRTLEYFGRSSEQMLGEGWQNVVHADDLENSAARWEKSFRTGEYFEAEIRLKRADGAYRWHLARATAGRDAKGEVVKWFGTNTDIHDQKLAEDALQENLSLLTSIFEATADGIMVVDLNNTIVIYNKQFIDMWRIPDEIIRSKDNVKTVDYVLEQLSNADEFAETTRKLILNPEIKNFDVLKFKDGKIYERYSQPQMLGGKVVGRVLSFRDITDRIRADDALRESESKFRMLVESTSEGLLQVNNEDCIQFVNNRLCEMVGYAQGELIGADWSRLLLDEAGREFIAEVNERRRRGISDRYEISLVKKSGEKLWVIIGGAPIMNADGEVVGSMGIYTDITERKLAEEQLLHDAFHDGLTGLANRSLFMDHLRMTIERSKSRHSNMYAVLFLDFDRFKVINDSLGHAEGDKLLKLVARRLESCTRTGDLVARFGGDEFVILLVELVEAEDAMQVAERIQESLKKPFDLSGNEIFISVSIGIALSTAGHIKADDMLRDADIAMYRAKAKGKAQYQVFDFEMQKQPMSQLQFETELRRAFERGEFQLHYQPIFSLDTQNLVGFEALIRWQHPERGLISPAEFVPVAEENGMIIRLGRWTVYESCRQLREWQLANPKNAASLTVAVNLSCKEFLQFDLAEQIAATLASTGLEPRYLKLEITESHIMENTQMAITIMNRLRALGIELSLDDFGTGYSSLSYLHRLPVSYLKIDRSFITGLIESRENAEIVYTIVKLGQNLKMKVIAEGIETAEQLVHLQQINCEYGQGYFFSKPLDVNKAKILIEENSENSSCLPNQPIINLDLNA